MTKKKNIVDTRVITNINKQNNGYQPSKAQTPPPTPSGGPSIKPKTEN